MTGWSYAARLLSPFNRITYVELIPVLRDALITVKKRGVAMEEAWANDQLLPKGKKPYSARNPKRMSENKEGVSSATRPRYP